MSLFDELPMIGGEVHYGRVQPRYWPKILDSMKDLGTTVVGCYVMWDFHEVREREYDFSALHAFLAETAKRDLRVLARPGPFFYAEWRNLGIPDHVVAFHKHHPEFRRKAATWITAVMNELRPYLGRLVVAVQADNEIDPMPHFYGEDLGFADWLRRVYGDVANVNAAWGTTYARFEDATPTLAPFAHHRQMPLERARLRDGCQYRYDLATEYARWVVGEYRRNGCEVPILLNTWPGVDAQHWRDLADLADFYGIDPYPTNECRDDYRYFRERLRLLRAVTPLPYLAEFGSGIWHGMPRREYTADHYRLTALTALASGVRGWNWYMLVDRDNWHGAPINERGIIRPELGDAFKQAVGWFQELRHAPAPTVSCGVTWSWHYHQLAQIEKRDVDDPLFGVLHDMGIEYDFIDVDRPISVPARAGTLGGPPKLLFVGGRLARPEHVWPFVDGGGILVMFQQLVPGIPLPDGTSHPGATNLEVVVPTSRMDKTTTLDTEESLRFRCDGAVFNYRSVPGIPVVATQQRVRASEDDCRLWDLSLGRQYITGFVETRNAGQIVVLGCPPSREAIIAVHRAFDVPIPVLSETAGVHVTVRGARVIVINHGEGRVGRVRINDVVRFIELPRYGGVIL